MKKKFADIKMFSLNDLIEMGLISEKDIQNYITRIKAEQFIKDNFKGMF